MIGAGRVSRRRPNPAVFLGHDVGRRERLGCAITEIIASLLVQALGKGLGQPVGDGLDQNRVVVVVVGLEAVGHLLDPQPGGDREGAHVIGQPTFFRGDEVGQGKVGRPAGGPALAAVHLLAQGMQLRHNLTAALIGIHLNVIADAVGRPEAVYPTGLNRAARAHAGQFVQQPQRVLMQFPGGLAHHRIAQNLGVMPGQLPGVEERRPVDPAGQFADAHVGDDTPAGKGGPGDVVRLPIDGEVSPAGLEQGQERFAPDPALELRAQGRLLGAVVLIKGLAQVVAEQRADHPNRPRGVDDVDDRRPVVRGDLERGMSLARCGPADEKRNLPALAGHLLRHVSHFVQ